MISNKNISNLSLQKMWDKFNKMNDVILVLLSTNWVKQEDGTFTNTIPYAGFSSEEVFEIDLYDDGNLSDTKITEYEEYITEFNINDGEMVAVAKTAPTMTISILVKGEFVANEVTIGNWSQVENNLAQFESRINELNTIVYGEITAYNTDNATITTGLTNTYIRKRSGIVELQLRFKPLVVNSGLIIANLPEGFRPLSRIVGNTQGVWEAPKTKEGIATFIIHPAGTVEINNQVSDTTTYPDGFVTNKELMLRAVYLVD